jgi:hypothetical protein
LRKILKKEISKIEGGEKGLPGRGSRTRGWRADSPKPGTDRHYLYQKCGKRCFLGEGESFPICAKCHGGKCSCRVDCRGVIAASVRSRQYKHKNLYGRINRLKRSCQRK